MKIKFSYEKYQNTLLLLLLMSGTLKMFLSYFDYPFDITLQVLILVIIDIFYNSYIGNLLKFKTYEAFYFGLILVFYAFALVSLTYTSSDKYGYIKLFDMLIPFIGFLYTKLIKELNLNFWYRLLFYIQIPISIWFILSKYLLWAGNTPIDFLIDKNKFNVIRTSYLNLGYLIGILGILSLKFSKRPFLVISLCCLIILGLGSRGALLFLIMSLLIIYFKELFSFFIRFKINRKIFKRLFFFLNLIIVFSFFFIDKIAYYLKYGLSRFVSLINFTSDESALGRIDQYIYVIENGFTLQGILIGHGLGSFGIDFLGEDIKTYPHNVLLEAWYEMGVFMMFILLMFLATPFLLKRAKILKVLALFAFLNAMKTLSFAYDRNLFILIGVLIFTDNFVLHNQKK